MRRGGNSSAVLHKRIRRREARIASFVETNNFRPTSARVLRVVLWKDENHGAPARFKSDPSAQQASFRVDNGARTGGRTNVSFAKDASRFYPSVQRDAAAEICKYQPRPLVLSLVQPGRRVKTRRDLSGSFCREVNGDQTGWMSFSDDVAVKNSIAPYHSRRALLLFPSRCVSLA